MTEPLTDVIDRMPLIDHHCHGVVTGDLDTAGLEALISEGGPPPGGTTNFDAPVGLAIRRHCAPLLDLEPHAPREAYLARRAELGGQEVTRRLLAGLATSDFCVDTGHLPDGLTTPEELAAIAGGRAHHIVRLEAVAESVAAAGVEPTEFAATYARALRAAIDEVGAVGVKSIAAYRVGLDFDPSPPSPQDVMAAADRWLRHPPETGRWRLADPVLTRALLETALDVALPIQFHVGFGDSDIRMHRVDPTLLTDWLHRHRVPVMLLHCWPYARQASFLSLIFEHVYLDVGASTHYVGPTRAAALLAEALDVTPFSKLLYSSDAFGAPELYALGALSFRLGLRELFTARVDSGEWAAADASRVAIMVGRDNAARVYDLDR